MTVLFKGLGVGLAVAVLAGCSLLPNHRLDYQQATVGEPLKLPADVTMIDNSQAYSLPDKGPLLAADKRGAFDVAMPAQLPSITSSQQEQQDDKTAGPAPDVSHVRSVMANDGNGYPMIMIHTRYAWAWEYVGDALKKSGVDVTDKDREAGLYYLRLAKSHDVNERDVELKLSHTTNGIQVVAMNKKGTALLDKSLGRVLLARLYAEL